MPTTAPTLPATLRLGATHLTVTDLDRSVAWYQTALGLRVHRHDAQRAELGDGEAATLVLQEDAQARRAGRHAGLYHVALLYPSREELARAALRLSASQTRIQGASDHVTHEAIYLPDPDGNGLELAADRPRETWPDPQSQMSEFSRGGPMPLDFGGLLGTVEGERAPAHVQPGLRTGHLHLHVGDLDRALAFYGDVLGFEVQARIPTAVFVSAGGYHHHLAFNVWQGEGAPPMPERTVGLRHWTVELATPAEVAEVRERVRAAGAAAEEDPQGFLTRDPWGLAVRLVTA
ncbi:MAG TPA: VOC family protein [Baekduia sp.]|nr:VOC family protein [Baekduia sp.]